MYVCMYVFDCTIWGFHPLGKPAELTAQYLILNACETYCIKTRHTVVCRAAQEAGV